MIYLIVSIVATVLITFIGYRAKQRSDALKLREPVKYHPLFSSNYRNLKGATSSCRGKLPPKPGLNCAQRAFIRKRAREERLKVENFRNSRIEALQCN